MNAQTLKSYNVQVSTDNKNWAKYTLIIAPSEFILFQYNLKTSHFWKLISRLEYNNHKIFINFIDNNYIIQSPNVSNLISDLCEVVQRILLPSELNNIEFSILNAPPIEPGTESADSRFMMQQTGNLHINTSQKEISSTIKYRTPIFRISNASEVGFLLHAYLDILPLIKTLKIIELPIIGVDYMKIISNFPLELRCTRKIEVNGSINPILFTFLERVKQNQDQSKLNSLSFSLSNFNRNDLSIISNSITRGPINSIEFHRAFHPSSVQYFYSTFLSHQMNGMLWILNLDKTTGIELSKLFPKIRNIPFVSLAYCDIDIIEALTIASESKMEKLTILNLTGNNALSSSIEKVNNIQKIATLRKLILDNINWPDHFTSQFLTALFNRFRSNLSLSFSKAKASENEWDELFEFFENSEYDGLVGFSWASNPINIELFHFLSRNGQLRTIDFDNCFDENCPELVKEFSSLLNASVHLRSVSVSGSNGKHIGRQILSVIEACIGHKSLRMMNFPFSNGGDEALPLIVQLAESTPELKILNFEGLCLTDQNSFYDSMMKLTKSKEGLKVNFPLEDLNKFKGILSKDDEKELKKAYKQSYTDPSSSNSDSPSLFSIKPASEPLLNKKRVYYRYYKKDSFPSYITDKTIQRLKDELVDIPDQIIDEKKKKKNKENINMSKTLGYVPKKPPPQQLNLTHRSSKGFIDSFAKIKVKKDEFDFEEEEEVEPKSTESEHPFEKLSYSESSDKKSPPKANNKNENTEDEDESLTQSFSSLSNPANQILRKSSNLPKNMAMSDYDSEEVYDHSTFKSPSNSKVTLSSGFDSLSNTDSIDGAEFYPTPQFDKSKPYEFSSDLTQNEELNNSEPSSNNKNYKNESSDESTEKEDEKIKKMTESPIKNKKISKKDSDSIYDVEFILTPKFDKSKPYEFSSDLTQNEELNNSEPSSNKPRHEEESTEEDEKEPKETTPKKKKTIKHKKQNKNQNQPIPKKKTFIFDLEDEEENKNKNKNNSDYDDEVNDREIGVPLLSEDSSSVRTNNSKKENNDYKRAPSIEPDEEINDNRNFLDSDDESSNEVNTKSSNKNKKKVASKTRNKKAHSDSNPNSENFSYSDADVNSSANKYDSYYSNDDVEHKFITINKSGNNTNSSIEIEIQNDKDSSIEIEINPVKDLINQNSQTDKNISTNSDDIDGQNQIQFPVPSETKNQTDNKALQKPQNNKKRAHSESENYSSDENQDTNNTNNSNDDDENNHNKSSYKERNLKINQSEDDEIEDEDEENKIQSNLSDDNIQYKISDIDEEEEENENENSDNKSETDIKDKTIQNQNLNQNEAEKEEKKAKKSVKKRSIKKTKRKKQSKPKKPKTKKKETKKVRVQKNDSNAPKIQNKEAEIESVPDSSDATESGKEAPFSFTPRTPKLSIHTKSIFNIDNESSSSSEEDYESGYDYYEDYSENDKDDHKDNKDKEPIKSKKSEINEVAAAGAGLMVEKAIQTDKRERKPADPRLPPIRRQRDWKFQIRFNMDPDLSQFKKIYKQNSPSVLYDILSKEKYLQSRNSSQRSKK